MIYRIKTFAVQTLRLLLKAGYVLPVDGKKILFSANEGRQYACNPKYVFEKMIADYPDMEYVWVLNDPSALPERYRGKVKVVKFLSPAHIRELLTSRVIMSNLGIEPFLPKRSGQTFINTWHGGGAYKKVSSDLDVFSDSQQKYIGTMRDLRKDMTDVFLSSCRRFSEVSAKDFNVSPDRFVATGMPRNDRLVAGDSASREKLRRDICTQFGIDPKALIVLYAPTFRGDHHNQRSIDNEVCCREVADALARRFGRNVEFMFRSHLIEGEEGTADLSRGGVRILNLTHYPDMQDLLDVCDVLITDYSSSVWDFALTGKPAFLYMPDLEEYQRVRGFYTPLEDWPYPHASDIPAFCRLIGSHDEAEAKARIGRHLSLLGSYETGEATAKVVGIIAKELTSGK